MNYPLPVISREQAAEDLAKADAIVQRCQRGEGVGEVGGPEGEPPISWPRGPFRPPTEPAAPGLGEQLWGHGGGEDALGPAMRMGLAGRSAMLLSGGGGARRRRPYEGDSAQASEEVQSNIVALDDASEVHAPPFAAASARRRAAPQAPSAACPAGPAPAELWQGEPVRTTAAGTGCVGFCLGSRPHLACCCW